MQPSFLLPAGAAFVLSALAAFFDVRERRIPNWLNYSFLLLAFVLAYFFGKLSIDYAIFVAACFVLAYAIYRLGAWAGGDVKFFTALMAFLPLLKQPAWHQPILVFLASAALIVPVMMVRYWREIYELRNQVLLAFYSSILPSLIAALFSTVLYIPLSIIFGGQVTLAGGAWAAAFGGVAAFGFGALKKIFSIISKNVLRKGVPVGKLREGDIPAQSVYLKKGRALFWEPRGLGEMFSKVLRKGRAGMNEVLPPPNPIVNCLKARGLTRGEIRKLKGAGVNKLVVKESVEFAPALALGFVVVAWLA